MTSSHPKQKSRILHYRHLFWGLVISVTSAIYGCISFNLKIHIVKEDLVSFLNRSSIYQVLPVYDDDFVFHASYDVGSSLKRLPPFEFTVNNDTENINRNLEQAFTSSISKTDESTRDDESTVCRIYLAPSTIPGAGFGLFAGIPYQKGNLVTPGDGVIPIYDMELHNELSSSLFLWDEYVWSGSTFSAMSEFDRTIEAASFGIGALPNCFFPLLNVEDSDDHGRDYANLDEVTSPGIGAFSPWYDRKSFAIQNIIEGSELFVDYGYEYFKSREETYGLVPFLNDYREADRLLKRFKVMPVFDRLLMQDTSSRNVVLEDTFQLSRNILIAWPNRVQNALPNTTEAIHRILKSGGTARKDYLRSIRSMDYLKNFGTCMDHLYVKPSQIPDAGRGVYTERFFKKGSVVTTVPLIHIQDRNVLNMYTDFIWHNDHHVQQQLLINYCFGHNLSTLLLCPYGIVSSLINHAPTALETTRTVPNQANLEIKWSTLFSRHPEWLNMSISEWTSIGSSGLCFEYIASRDILKGEELLIDYGIEWHHAWNLHVANWSPIELLVDKLNAANSIIPTEKEWIWPSGDIIRNPGAVNLWCYNDYRTMQGFDDTEEKAFPCKVVNRKWDSNREDYFYTAELLQIEQNDELMMCIVLFDEVLWSLPRDAFVYGDFFDHIFSKHFLFPNAFRHDMRIPDGLMPNVWKNIYY